MPLFELLLQEVPEAFETIQNIVIVLGWPPWLDGKVLSLKTLQLLDFKKSIGTDQDTPSLLTSLYGDGRSYVSGEEISPVVFT